MTEIAVETENKQVVPKYLEGKALPIIIEIKPFYTVIQADGTAETYNTLIDIAKDNDTNISNIYHLVNKKKVKGLNFKVEKEKEPYCFTHRGIYYSVQKIESIANISHLSISKIHSIIKEFLSNENCLFK